MRKFLTKRILLSAAAALSGVGTLGTAAVLYINRPTTTPEGTAAAPAQPAQVAAAAQERPSAEVRQPAATDLFAAKRRYESSEAEAEEPTVRSRSTGQTAEKSDGFPSADQAFAGEPRTGVSPASHDAETDPETAPGRADPFARPAAEGRYSERAEPVELAGQDPGEPAPQELHPGPAMRLAPQAEEREAVDDEPTAADRYDDPTADSEPAGQASRAFGGNDESEGDAAAVDGAGRPGESQLDGPQSPSVTVEKVAPAEIQIGKTAQFEIRVRNDGPVAAHDVEVHDEVPEGTQLTGTSPEAELGQEGAVVWVLGLLKPGEERTLTMELMPTDEGEIGSVARVYFAAVASARTRATRPQLIVEVQAPEQVLIGETLNLTIHVSNPGSGAATGIIVEAALPEGLEHEAGPELEYEVGDLQPGESRDVELAITASKAGRTASLIVARGDGNLAAEQQADIDVLAPELEVGLTGSKRRYLEREATYTVSISNPGTAPAQEIELATYLPQGLEFVKADNYGEYDAETRVVRWSLEELPPGETGEVTLVALPTAAGEQKLVIEGAAARGLEARQEQSITVEGVAAILFEVVDVADPIEVGTETTYEIRVVNQGSKAASDVRLVVLLPDQMEFADATGPVEHTVEDQQVIFESLPQLAPKADTTYQVKVRGLAAGDQRVNVQLLTGDMQAPVTKEENTHVLPNE